MIPIDILPVFKSPAVQTLTFYNGMSANSIANDITNRMERWTGQANGTLAAGVAVDHRRQHRPQLLPGRRRSQRGARPRSTRWRWRSSPTSRPARLPPVVLPFDPTARRPSAWWRSTAPTARNNESVLYDVGRYEVRNMIMASTGAVAPVVYGGKIRAVMAYLDRQKMQARGLSPLDVMKALDA